GRVTSRRVTRVTKIGRPRLVLILECRPDRGLARVPSLPRHVLFGRIDRLSRLGSFIALAVPLACVRPPVTGACPEVQAGGLTITEIRGAQSGPYRQWIELYNAGDADIAVAGMSLVFTRLNGAPGGRLFIRDEGLVVAPGAHVVLGGGDPARYGYIDYDYTPDWHSGTNVDNPTSLPGSGFFDL